METIPKEREADKRAKFKARRDWALALVLSIERLLLYLLGDPEDPVAVWKKLLDQFQKWTWANNLQLRRRLYSLKEAERGRSCSRAHPEILKSLLFSVIL